MNVYNMESSGTMNINEIKSVFGEFKGREVGGQDFLRISRRIITSLIEIELLSTLSNQ
jgi:hypothetical protein